MQVYQLYDVHIFLASSRCIYTDEDIKKIKEILQSGHMKWFVIGLKLKISSARLQAIKKQYGDSSIDCFNAMMDEWLLRSPELGLLVAVLRQREINLTDPAERLEGEQIL